MCRLGKKQANEMDTARIVLYRIMTNSMVRDSLYNYGMGRLKETSK